MGKGSFFTGKKGDRRDSTGKAGRELGRDTSTGKLGEEVKVSTGAMGGWGFHRQNKKGLGKEESEVTVSHQTRGDRWKRQSGCNVKKKVSCTEPMVSIG